MNDIYLKMIWFVVENVIGKVNITHLVLSLNIDV